MSSTDSKAVYERMVKLLAEQRLTPYESDVVTSMIGYYDKKGRFSEKQINFFRSIEENYTSEAIEKRSEWDESFDDEKKETLRIVAQYYYNNGTYYYALASKIIEDENYVPSEKVYRTLCENKYSKKVLEETKKEPKFSVGQMVYHVTKAPCDVRNILKRGGIVLRANTEPVISACKGAKRYLVLPVGHSHGIIVEERWLKTRRNKKRSS